MKIDVAVIGGGASGLAAAIAAAGRLRQAGVLGKTVIFERGQRVGRKLLATGNGRCNLSNRFASPERYHGGGREFVEKVLARFSVENTLDFFDGIGLPVIEDGEGRLYPRSQQAAAVLDVLRIEAERLGAETLCGQEIVSITFKGGSFLLVNAEGQRFAAQAVIVAAGGEASPSLGGGDGGYRLLTGLGHRVTPRLPAIVQLKTDTSSIKGLSGLKAKGGVSLAGTGARASGEILFTDYGLSGLAVMELSGEAVRRMAAGEQAAVLLDLAEEFSEAELVKFLARRAGSRPEKRLEDFLVGFLPKRVGQCALKAAGAGPLSREAGSLGKKEIAALAAQLKRWRLAVTGHNGMKNAQVTAGGAAVCEFSAASLESKRCPGLYACGEVLDVDGDCGGFNLQWAWSSGRLAGESAAMRVIGHEHY